MNQRRYQKKIEKINDSFRKNLLSHPQQASKAFTHDLGATIRAYNASQLKKGMSNSQSNKQSSSGSATNQNRVIGGHGPGAISGGKTSGTGLSGGQHFTPSRPNLVNAPGGGIQRSPLHLGNLQGTPGGGSYGPKGGPAGGKPIVNPPPYTKKQAVNTANPGYAEALAQLKARRSRRARAPRPYAA